MLIDAAIDGQGVALARTTLAAWDLISGRIVLPFDLSWRPAGTYWILSQKAMAKVEKIRRFRDWLLAEAADDAPRRASAPPLKHRSERPAPPPAPADDRLVVGDDAAKEPHHLDVAAGLACGRREAAAGQVLSTPNERAKVSALSAINRSPSRRRRQ